MGDEFIALVKDCDATVEIGSVQLISKLVEAAGIAQLFSNKSQVFSIQRKNLYPEVSAVRNQENRRREACINPDSVRAIEFARLRAQPTP